MELNDNKGSGEFSGDVLGNFFFFGRGRSTTKSWTIVALVNDCSVAGVGKEVFDESPSIEPSLFGSSEGEYLEDFFNIPLTVSDVSVETVKLGCAVVDALRRVGRTCCVSVISQIIRN